MPAVYTLIPPLMIVLQIDKDEKRGAKGLNRQTVTPPAHNRDRKKWVQATVLF